MSRFAPVPRYDLTPSMGGSLLLPIATPTQAVWFSMVYLTREVFMVSTNIATRWISAGRWMSTTLKITLRTQMRHSFIKFIALFFAFASASAAELIPPHLVGVWATEQSVLQGPYLFEGQAMYLGADGIGVFVGGPPAIGFKIVATFDPKTNTIEFDVYEGKQRGPHGSISYDPKQNTVDSGAPQHRPMSRRFNSFTEEMKKGLGL
jgi:hypothetical protein